MFGRLLFLGMEVINKFNLRVVGDTRLLFFSNDFFFFIIIFLFLCFLERGFLHNIRDHIVLYSLFDSWDLQLLLFVIIGTLDSRFRLHFLFLDRLHLRIRYLLSLPACLFRLQIKILYLKYLLEIELFVDVRKCMRIHLESISRSPSMLSKKLEIVLSK